MVIVSIIGYSLDAISDMNFDDRMAYATSIQIILDNEQSNHEFTFQKITKENFDVMTTIPETIETGKEYTIGGEATNPIQDGIVHLYYTYGKNYTAQFISYFDPFGDPVKCSQEAGSSEISITCYEDSSIQFEIKDTNP
ncbi:MAG: hypothetical protein R3321_06535 [Nitrososphaeraceae archaeon]|nr:hypothetical protein [Nitrososphaeraceae archaeon]